MVGGAFIFVGTVMMLFGVVMLMGWVSGKARWIDRGVYDREGSSKVDRLLLDVYFLATVVMPLLCGGILIVIGLRQVL